MFIFLDVNQISSFYSCILFPAMKVRGILLPVTKMPGEIRNTFGVKLKPTKHLNADARPASTSTASEAGQKTKKTF